jgi:hypothetical protein
MGSCGFYFGTVFFFLVAVAFVYAFHQARGVFGWCYWRVFNHLGYFCAMKFQNWTRDVTAIFILFY